MTKRMIKNASYEGERPLFASRHLRLEDVIIYPGESALKECSDIEAVRCEFRGKYPFWHNDGLLVEHCLFREGARAAIWYSRNLHMKDTRVEAPKMFRDMDGMVLENVVLTDALECCWHCRNAKLRGVQAEHGDYLFMHGENIDVDGFRLNGNYSFQYCRNVVIRNAEIHSKDAFWNTEDVTVYDSVVDGEYLGWHSRNLRLVNCRIARSERMRISALSIPPCMRKSRGVCTASKIRAAAALLRKSTGILFWTSIARLLPIAPLKREKPNPEKPHEVRF